MVDSNSGEFWYQFGKAVDGIAYALVSTFSGD